MFQPWIVEYFYDIRKWENTEERFIEFYYFYIYMLYYYKIVKTYISLCLKFCPFHRLVLFTVCWVVFLSAVGALH